MASVSDNFDRGDGEIGANWTEDAGSDIDIVSNKADAKTAGTGNFCRARYTGTAMSSTDHYAQVIVGYNAGGPESGPTVRQASDAMTNYCFLWDAISATFGSILRRHVAGVQTDLAYGAGNFTVDKTFKVECNGTTIKAYIDGVETESVTDSGVTTGNYVGLHGYGTKGLYNDFAGADLAAGGSPYTLVAGVGAHTLSGQAVTTKYGRLLSAATGDYLLSGQSILLTYSGGAIVEEPRGRGMLSSKLIRRRMHRR